MTRLAALVLILVFGSAVAFDTAHARRAALVIGINDYDEVTDLEKAVGDARAMASALRDLGFDVTEIVDVNRRDLNQAITQFTATLTEGDTAFVHFSGHGVEIDGENYLLPADVPIPGPGQSEFVKSEAVAMSDLVARVALGGARTRVFVIDACRDNPFEQAGVRSIGGTRGLARVEAPAGTFIMYSAGYRQQALDRLGEDDNAETSVYTRTLIQHLATPGRPIDDIAQDVRREVEQMARTIGHNQRPAYYDELSARLILVEPVAQPDMGEPDPPIVIVDPPIRQRSECDDASQVWGTIQTTDSIAVLEAFADQFPECVYARFAHARLAELRGPEPEPEPELDPAPTSDADALAEEASQRRRDGDYREAFRLASQAAALGNARGMFLVALAYDFGDGVPLDDVEGSHWYLQAAEAGHSVAMFNLAWNYEHGEGVKQDGREAVRWYTRAAEEGDSDAMFNLGWMYEQGTVVTQDYNEAADWYRQGADAGNADAILNLGVLYDEGRGVPLDDAEAVRLYRLASDKGSAQATFNLGWMYDYGEGVAVDDLEAVRWYRQAADKGHTGAMLNLGIMYDTGEGVGRDPQAAASFLIGAISGGEDKAREQLVDNSGAWSSQFRVEFQRLLRSQGVYSGAIDGEFGPETRQAIESLASRQ